MGDHQQRRRHRRVPDDHRPDNRNAPPQRDGDWEDARTSEARGQDFHPEDRRGRHQGRHGQGSYQDHGGYIDENDDYRAWGSESGQPADQRGESYGRAAYGREGQEKFSASYGRTDMPWDPDGSSPDDREYTAWRRTQIQQMDTEYAEFRKERQGRFEEEFSNWRRQRQPVKSDVPKPGTEKE